LPGRQQELLERLVAGGSPVVLVVMGGSPIDLSWAQEHVSAILMAWYPGEQGGSAIADVLFGDDSPAGRLPVTFPRSLDDLPPFRDYSMLGRTYRYSDVEPLYPFGYGLSYTQFAYSDAEIAPGIITAHGTAEITATLENVGDRTSDEVAQCYVKRPAAAAQVTGELLPRLSLVGFRRVHLAPGEKMQVCFSLDSVALAVCNREGSPAVVPGEYRVSIGGGQPHRPESGAVTAELTVKDME
jgi:beta-glucosidase